LPKSIIGTGRHFWTMSLIKRKQSFRSAVHVVSCHGSGNVFARSEESHITADISGCKWHHFRFSQPVSPVPRATYSFKRRLIDMASNTAEPLALSSKVASERRHTAAVIAVWAVYPLAIALLALRNGATETSRLLFATSFTSLAAAGIGSFSKRGAHIVSVVLLLGAWLPWLARMIELFSLSFGRGLLKLADSPLPFLINVLFLSVIVAALPVFAASLWARRSAA
jgi:hypothetical protein